MTTNANNTEDTTITHNEVEDPKAAVPLPRAADGPSVAAQPLNEEDEAQFHLAFQRVEHEIRAVDPEQVMTVNIDISAVITKILGSYAEIAAQRSAIEKLDSFDVELLDKLQDYALALGHTHTLYTMATKPRGDLGPMAENGAAIRDQYRADATALAKRGLIDPGLTARLQNGVSYRDIGFDLVMITETLVAAWPTIAGKVAFTRDELDKARRLGNRIVKLVGLREQAPVERDKAILLRQQALTLCAHAYEEVRMAIGYARRHLGDVDDIAPSLFEGRGGRPPKAGQVTEPQLPSNGGTGSEVAPAMVGTSEAGAQATANTPTNTVPVGHPGSPAFRR